MKHFVSERDATTVRTAVCVIDGVKVEPEGNP